MNLIAIIANELFDNAPVFDLPRWRVHADIRAKYGCGDFTAREAYALGRLVSGQRKRRHTVRNAPHQEAA